MSTADDREFIGKVKIVGVVVGAIGGVVGFVLKKILKKDKEG